MYKSFFLGVLLASAASADWLSIGVRGGVPFTGAFSDFVTSTTPPTRIFTDSNEYLIGPMVELHLPLGLSVEADALYRPLNQTTVIGNIRNSTNITSWEFPILGKFHFPFPIVKPLIEAGPSFRHTGRDYISNSGFTLGAGVEIKLLRLRIEPEIRYTRWGSDSRPAPNVFFAPTNQDQAAFLIGLAF
jgi:hypothetical protein